MNKNLSVNVRRPSQAVGILDLGIGNVRSIGVALLRANIDFQLLSEPDFSSHQVVLIPGVGHFSAGVAKLTQEIRSAILDHVSGGGGLIGVCLGMQLLGETSEEGYGQGLGLLPFRSTSLSITKEKFPPATGWIAPRKIRPKWLGLGDDERYYFMHEFGVKYDGQPYATLTAKPSDYYEYLAALQVEKIIGFQFHPERSLTFGQNILAAAIREIS